MLLTFHHIIGDGISGAYVVRDLLERSHVFDAETELNLTAEVAQAR